LAAEPARTLVTARVLVAARALVAALVAALAAGCTQTGTGVDLTIDGANLTVDELDVIASFGGLSLTDRARPAAPLALPTHLLAELPDRPTTVTFDVTGKLAGAVVGHGTSDPIAVAAHQIAPGRVSLTPAGGELGPPPDLAVVTDAATPDDLATADLATPPDLTVPIADLASPPDLAWTDLAAVPITFLGHGESRMTSQNTVLAHVSPFAGALQSGDFLLLAVYAEGAQVSATPAGWTYVASATTAGSSLAIYQKSAGASESDFNVQLNAVAGITSSVMIGYRNVRAVTPFDALNNPPSTAPGVPPGNNTIVFSAPSITTTRPHDRLVAIYMYQSGQGESWIGAPANLNSIVSWQELAAYQGDFVVPGATGVESATATFSPGSDGTTGGAWVGALSPP